MRVVIAGGHGKIALILERLLSQRGDSVAGFIRNPDHVADLEAAGAQALVVDLRIWTAPTPSSSPLERDPAAERHARRPSTATPPSCWRTPPNRPKSAAT
jgi:microcystin degradation protein MlrC